MTKASKSSMVMGILTGRAKLIGESYAADEREMEVVTSTKRSGGDANEKPAKKRKGKSSAKVNERAERS